MARGGATETLTADSGVFCGEATVAALAAAMDELEQRDWQADAARAAAERFSVARFRRDFMVGVEAGLGHGA